MKRQNIQQGGFAAIAAIFLVVVLAALGGFMVSFSNTQQITSAQDIQGSRAYWAARAGLGWSLASLTATPAGCPSPPASPFIVDGFTLTMGCTPATYTEAGATVTIYRVTSRASQGSGVSAVERSVSASIEF
jgi:MSHA biogenesis protein MshP